MRPAAYLSLLLALASGLAGCAEDPVDPVSVQRLLVDASAWSGEGEAVCATVGDEVRAARELPSGVWASRSCTVPDQPCWLYGFVAPAAHASAPAEAASALPDLRLIVEVEHQGQRTRVVEERPVPEPLHGGFARFRADLRQWSGQEVSVHLQGTIEEGGTWWLAGLVVEPQEVFDSRVRSVVLILCPPEVMAQAAGWAESKGLSGLRRLARRSVLHQEVDRPGANFDRDALLADCTAAMLEQGRECFAFGARAPAECSELGPAGFDLWRTVDPFLGEPGPSQAALAQLLHGFGRTRPQSLFVTVHTQASEAELAAGVDRLMDQLQADGQWPRSTVVLAALPEPGAMATSMLVRYPDRDPRAPEQTPATAQGQQSLAELPELLRGPSTTLR